MSVSIHPVEGPVRLGCEVRGVDLSKALDNETFAPIERAFHEYSVVYFRDQKLTPEDHIRFSERFGKLADYPGPILNGYPVIGLISNIIENGKPIGNIDAGILWHTDMSYVEEPSLGSVLHAIEIPHDDAGNPLGATNYTNTAAAYDALPEETKRRVAGLKAVHLHSSYIHKKKARFEATRGGPREVESVEEIDRRYPPVIHPVIRTHPVTGRRCIYVSEGESVGIVGMPDKEALALIKELSDFCIRSEFRYTHRWRVGDVLIWDNCSTQHLATFDYRPEQRRLLHRTTIEGSAPF